MRRLTSALLAAYRDRFDRVPEWDYPLPPPIPFVGQQYDATAPRIALYASAENLAHYERKPETIPPFLRDERAWNRHRMAFDSSPKVPLPRLHIAPVENGSLLCAVLFILQTHFGAAPPEHPWQLAEQLSIANLAKFSIKTVDGKNRDYAGKLDYLRDSLPYFSIDLEILQPDVLILPMAMHRHEEVRALIASAVPGAMVAPVPQFNATVVNTHLARHADRAAELGQFHADSQLAGWTSLLKGYGAGYPYRYYAHLEEILGDLRRGDGRQAAPR